MGRFPGPRTVHLCVDMQWISSLEADPSMSQSLALFPRRSRTVIPTEPSSSDSLRPSVPRTCRGCRGPTTLCPSMRNVMVADTNTKGSKPA
jgi:hypothetical protein